MKAKLYQHLASAVDAMRTCERTNNVKWQEKHMEAIAYIMRNHMPSGAGIDSGTQIDLDKSSGEKLVFDTSYHHMNDSGCYDGWTEHTVTVRADLISGITIAISGRDRNEIKDYLTEVFHTCLTQELDTREAYGVPCEA
jgi:hypothetical protein